MTLRLRRIVPWAIAGLALAIGVVAAIAAFGPSNSRPRFQAVDITGVHWGKEFALTDHLGRKRSLADFRGKAVALYFGYTHCPDMCPITLATLGEALRKLGSDADAVQGLFVTVDPERDTPEILSQYVPSFYPSFLGLYGDEAATARAAQEFKAYYHANPPDERGSYTVDHSSQLYVIDPTGRLRLYMKTDAMTPDSIAHDLRALLREARS